MGDARQKNIRLLSIIERIVATSYINGSICDTTFTVQIFDEDND